ncbi:hypothetical protein BDP27DRAFT_1432393 [Rhodocollybia butyracea]|uniref:DUF7704 domain-containing protein n=1 Tax=Rhodocollybia butyracea TaxID=206335 RepID=A0A9P5P8I5_9AGAR|nr:hypothetical protein BDP27DRAFT_1432393 [Rhodocollybia butyracea]
MSDSLRALPGFYKLLFLYLEPISAILPAPMIWLWPGAAWFHYEQIPTSSNSSSPAPLDPRTLLALSQLGNCYMLVGLMVSLVFRVARDAFPGNPIAQERIIGGTLTALAIADVFHVLSTFIGLPSDIRFSPMSWNGITHGNITLTTFLFCVRMAWFLGIGRHRYYYGPEASRTSGRKIR